MTRYLHENSEKFRDKVIDIANSSGRAESIVEKDYYLTNLLETISKNTPLVFKGGTSLSKGHNIINRFSEDIDFCVPEHLTRGERRNVRDVIVDAIESMGLSVQDKDALQSGSRFNKYIAPYDSIDEEPIVFPQIMIETNMIHPSLLHHVIPIDGFDGVKRFNADTQDIEETLHGKAVCNLRLLHGKYTLQKLQTSI